MADLEKVIKGLECCIEKLDTVTNKTHGFNCMACPYFRRCDSSGYLLGLPLMKNALALLKAQEPKPPLVTENAYGWKFYHCPSCGREFYGDRLHGRMNKSAFCDKCGQAVKWDE